MQAVKSIAFQSYWLEMSDVMQTSCLYTCGNGSLYHTACMSTLAQPCNIHIGRQACMKGLLLRRLPLLVLTLSITVEVVI